MVKVKKDPGNNFYIYVNNEWLNKTHIPNYTSSFSVNEEIEEYIDKDLFTILKECESKKTSVKKTDVDELFKKSIGSLIRSVDFKKNSLLTLKEKIQSLHCIRSIDDIGEVLGYLIKHKVPSLIGAYLQLERTKDNTSIYTLVLSEGVLGLSDITYYNATAPGKLTTLYSYIKLIKSVSKLLEIYDLSDIIPLESFFSGSLKQSTQVYDDSGLYKGSHLIKEFPNFPWKSFFTSLGVEDFMNNIFRIQSKTWINTLEKSFTTVSFEQWKKIFILHTILHALPILPPPFDDIYFDFFENRLKGQDKKLPNKYLKLQLVKDYLSTQLSILYKNRFLDNSLKKEATEFIETIRKSAIQQVESNTWMNEKTKKKAMNKVKDMILSIGWPEQYPPIYIAPLTTDNLLSNIYVLSSSEVFEEIQLLNKKSKPGTTWEEPSYLVNAFYYNEINEFVIPAGILMYPFYDKNASIGWNYGGLGAVIGHEMIHAFDTDGKHYNEHGMYETWWTKTDDLYYKKVSKNLIHLYNSSKIYGVAINGEKTLNENLADLGGLSIALGALKKEIASYHDSKKKVELQKFFISYAVSWRTKEDKLKVLQSLFTDVHSPPECRVNNIVVHFDEWYEVFDIKNDDTMFIEPNKRIRVF